MTTWQEIQTRVHDVYVTLRLHIDSVLLRVLCCYHELRSFPVSWLWYAYDDQLANAIVASFKWKAENLCKNSICDQAWVKRAWNRAVICPDNVSAAEMDSGLFTLQSLRAPAGILVKGKTSISWQQQQQQQPRLTVTRRLSYGALESQQEVIAFSTSSLYHRPRPSQ